jgi:hypothetical protein
MADSTWPMLAADTPAKRVTSQRVWWPTDPLDLVELPPLVFPRPKIDKALTETRDD